MNPISMAVAAVIVAGTFLAGWQVNGWRIHAQEARAEDSAQKAGDAATKAAVAAIQALRPVYTTINKAVERETHTETRYTDAGCAHTPVTWGLLDQAYQAAGGQPFDSGAGLQPATAPVGP